MSEMIERVAKALSVADGNHPDACSNDEDETPMWTLYVKDARAAVEAMREEPPPELMLNYFMGVFGEEVWRIGIDAALKPEDVA
jgi:hypothetical protein